MSDEKKTHPEHKYSVTFVSKVGTKKSPSFGLVKSYNLSYNSDLSYNFISCKFFHIVRRVSFNIWKAGAVVWFVAKEFNAKIETES